MRAVDTNLLVRLLARDDPRQAAHADAFVAKGAWISHLVLAETVWVLSSIYELDSTAIVTSIEMLLEHQSLSIQEPETVRTALEQFRERPSLAFSDYLILEVARAAGHLPLGTFDRHLAKLSGAERV